MKTQVYTKQMMGMSNPKAKFDEIVFSFEAGLKLIDKLVNRAKMYSFSSDKISLTFHVKGHFWTIET